MPKFVSIADAVKMIPNGATVMFGGFLGCGSAHRFIDALSKSGVKDLTAICNDAGTYNTILGDDRYGIAKLVRQKQIKKLIGTHIGLNPEAGAQVLQDHTLELLFLPQGSFVEMIRAGGSGLGGILTPTGVGTLVEESPLCLGKQNINGRDYLLMAPLHADYAVVGGSKIDKAGNIWYKGTTSNFNIVMAMAADTVIAEAEEVVEIGEIAPENVRTAGVFVDYVVEGGKY